MNLKDYKQKHGKRFRRTKEEVELGLSPEEALAKRLGTTAEAAPPTPAKNQRRPLHLCHIVIKPEKGTDPDFLEHLPKNIEVEVDNKWLGWYDTLHDYPFDSDPKALLEFILEHGLIAAMSHKYAQYTK
jgi:hypothetical protein